MRVAVVGLGRIGLPTAVLCAMRGHDVIGVDRDPEVLRRIAARDMPYEEPGLEGELHRIDTSHTIDGVRADVWIVAVGTATAGRLDPDAVRAVVADIARVDPRLVVVESTVPPGLCDELARHHGLPIAHCPERARPGQVFEDIATTPRLIGGIDDATTSRAVDFYATITDAPLNRCAAAEAALAKLAENAEREVRIAFANELADAAFAREVDAARVIELANTHPRADILRPGVGVGGLCLPIATRWFAAQTDGVAAAARALHDRRPDAIAERIARDVAPGSKICVLGRTYRPDTRYEQRGDGSDHYASPAVALIAALRERGFDVTSWDPSDENGSRAEAEAGADLVYVAVGHRCIVVRSASSGDTPA